MNLRTVVDRLRYLSRLNAENEYESEYMKSYCRGKAHAYSSAADMIRKALDESESALLVVLTNGDQEDHDGSLGQADLERTLEFLLGLNRQVRQFLQQHVVPVRSRGAHERALHVRP